MFFALEKSKDTTLAALATHLGLELPTIGFGAFLAFELHQVPDANATNAEAVKVIQVMNLRSLS